MRTLTVISAVVGLGVLVMPSVEAAPIPGLFTTGVSNNSSLLPLGSQDPHYTVIESNTASFAVTYIPPNYMPNNQTSQWIWQNANGQPTNVTRTFRTTFDLTGFDATTALINGTWATDNIGVDILINGISTGQSIPFYHPTTQLTAFQYFTPFTISNGFLPGLNTLDFVVKDQGVIGGFRVGEISGTATVTSTSVPEPSSTLVLLAGTLTLGLSSALKRKQG